MPRLKEKKKTRFYFYFLMKFIQVSTKANMWDYIGTEELILQFGGIYNLSRLVKSYWHTEQYLKEKKSGNKLIIIERTLPVIKSREESLPCAHAVKTVSSTKGTASRISHAVTGGPSQPSSCIPTGEPLILEFDVACGLTERLSTFVILRHTILSILFASWGMLFLS
jgi:hypothetical protein